MSLFMEIFKLPTFDSVPWFLGPGPSKPQLRNEHDLEEQHTCTAIRQSPPPAAACCMRSGRIVTESDVGWVTLLRVHVTHGERF